MIQPHCSQSPAFLALSKCLAVNKEARTKANLPPEGSLSTVKEEPIEFNDPWLLMCSEKERPGRGMTLHLGDVSLTPKPPPARRWALALALSLLFTHQPENLIHLMGVQRKWETWWFRVHSGTKNLKLLLTANCLYSSLCVLPISEWKAWRLIENTIYFWGREVNGSPSRGHRKCFMSIWWLCLGPDCEWVLVVRCLKTLAGTAWPHLEWLQWLKRQRRKR